MTKNKIKFKAIILAGGKGSRLGVITKKTPKPLLKINRKEFLYYVIEYLKKNNINDFIVTTSYKSKLFDNYLTKNKNHKIKLVKEKNELGTGGSFLNVLKKSYFKKGHYHLLCNADTLLLFKLKNFINDIKKYQNCIFAVKRKNCSRYGKLQLKNGFIQDIVKNDQNSGLISSGIFIFKNFNTKIFNFNRQKLNFEEDIIKTMIKKNIKIKCLKVEKPFLDIGVPRDLKKAKKFIENEFGKY